MKKIINWFRDLIYNITDYTIILAVIAVVAVILVWRFNILFNMKIDKHSIAANQPIVEISANTEDPKDSEPIKDDNSINNESNDNTNNDTTPDNQSQNNDSKINENDNDKDNEAEKPNSDTQATSPEPVVNVGNAGQEIKINIPSGSFPGKIGDILLASGLINDKQVFLNRCAELQLDTKLKAGDFTIVAGSSLDDIIKTIAK